MNEKKFIKSVFTLAGGTFVAQLLPFIVLPVLQRDYFGPTEFGLLTLYVTLSDLLIGISGMKYEYAIVNTNRLKDAVNLLSLSVVSILTMSIFSLVVLSIIYFLIPSLSFVQNLGLFLFFVPLSVLFYGVFDAINFWLNRSEKYLHMSLGKVVYSGASESVKLISGIRGLGDGLIFGRIAGQFLAFCFNVILFFKNYRNMLGLVSLKRMKELVVIHKRYPIYVMPSVLIGALITFAYIQLFQEYFGGEKVGLMGVSVSYIAVAFGILSSAFGQVFYKKIADVKDYFQLKKLYVRYALWLCVPSALTVLFVYLLPDEWVVDFLGERWAEMLPVTRIMVLWMSVSFVSSSLSFIYLKLEIQKTMFLLDLIHLVLVIAFVIIGHTITGTFMGTLYYFVAAQFIHYLMAIYIALFYLKKKSIL
ncbi:MAG: lipopolysaccharide biosynthesis protein [Flavobacteriales bacterium]